MRRLLAALLILLTAGTPVVPAGIASFGPPSATSSSARTESAPLTWERQYDNHANADFAWDIAETPQGDFVVVGSTGPTPCVLWCNWDGWVIKIDAQGEFLWSRQLGGNGDDLLASVIVTGEDFLIAGSKYVFPYARQAWLVKMTRDGDVAWEKTLGGSQADSAAEIIPCSDGNFLVIGQTESYGTQDGKADVWLMKITPAGDLVWARTYDLGAEDIGSSIAPFSGGRFIVAAIACTDDCDGFFRQGFASYLILDAGGNLLKKAAFPDGPKSTFLKVKPTADGGAILVGATSVAEKFPSEDMWVVKLDANGDVSWTRIVRSWARYDGAADVIQTPDGAYVVVAYTQAYQRTGTDFDNVWMLRFSGDGHLLWECMWGGPDNDDPHAVIQAADGGVVIAGFRDAVSWPLTEIPGPADFYVVRTSAERVRVSLPSVFKGAR